MSKNNPIYKHRTKVKSFGLILLLAGIVLAYFYYGTEPYETIAGFLCGFGLSILLVSIVINKSY